MADTKTTIELNGTVYDAVTGAPISSTAAPASTPATPAQTPQTSAAPVNAPASTGRNLDGFMTKPAAQPSAKIPQQKPLPEPRATVNPAQARQPERAKTLMRHTLDKPTVSAPPSSAPSQPGTPTVAPNTAAESRKMRAQKVDRSPSISKFGSAAPSVDTKVAHMPVQEAPKPASAVAAPTITPAAPQLRPIQQKIADHPAPSEAAASFTNALANATSHELVKLDKPKMRERTAKKLGTTSRVLAIGGTSLVVLLVAGFVAFKNIPNIQMKLAAARAGFSASLPGYIPSGFSMNGGVKASGSEVTVDYASNSDDRTFQVSQKPSNWTSESLMSNYVSSDKRAFQTYEDRGKTIYMYDGSSATWVNGGVWYEIKGNSSLTSDQLLHIANSF